MVSYSKKYAEEASFKAKNIAACACKAFGDWGLEFFSLDMAYVKTLRWDDKTGLPITKNEVALDQILTHDPELNIGQMFDFSEMELLKKRER